MSRRQRQVPSWLEGSCGRSPGMSGRQESVPVLPRSVVYVMSPKELVAAAEVVLLDEKTLNINRSSKNDEQIDDVSESSQRDDSEQVKTE